MLSNDNYLLEFAKGNSNTGGGSLRVSNTVFIDGVLGDDLTAERGNASKPCATIARAKVLAQSFDNIVIWNNLTGQEHLNKPNTVLNYYSYANTLNFTDAFLFSSGVGDNSTTRFYSFNTALRGTIKCAFPLSFVCNTKEVQIFGNSFASGGLYVFNGGGSNNGITYNVDILNILLTNTAFFYFTNLNLDTRFILGDVTNEYQGTISLENVKLINAVNFDAFYLVNISNSGDIARIITKNIDINISGVRTVFNAIGEIIEFYAIGRIDTNKDFYPNVLLNNKLTGWLYNYDPNLTA